MKKFSNLKLTEKEFFIRIGNKEKLCNGILLAKAKRLLPKQIIKKIKTKNKQIEKAYERLEKAQEKDTEIVSNLGWGTGMRGYKSLMTIGSNESRVELQIDNLFDKRNKLYIESSLFQGEDCFLFLDDI